MDTFRIKIKNYTVTDKSFFEEIKASSFANAPQFKKDKTNTAYLREMKKKGIYIPKYKISEVDFGIPDKGLVLEFSASKLLHDTNLKSVSEKDFPAIVAKLAEFLKSIKVLVFTKDIENAIVTLVAYSKNIPIGHLGSAQEVIRVIAPFNYRPRSEYRKVLFREKEKMSELKYFNNNSHLTVYDKLAEIISKPVTKLEQGITAYLKKGKDKDLYENWVGQTLRVELTLHSKMAVKQTLGKFYRGQTNFTFKQAFSDKICETLLTEEVNNVFNHPLQKIVLLTLFDQDVFNKVINQYCTTLAQHREMRVALDILYARGLKAYRADILSKASERTWFRKLKLLRKICDDIVLPKSVTQIDSAEVLEYLLSQFGIEPKLREPQQLELFK